MAHVVLNELTFAEELSEEDPTMVRADGGHRAPAITGADDATTTSQHAAACGGESLAAATTADVVSSTNVKLAAVREAQKERPDSFDAVDVAAGTAGGACTADDDAGQSSFKLTCTTPPTQDQWTTAMNKAAAHRSERRRRCRGCREWWRSSAGGKSGVFSVVLVVVIMLYAAFIVASPVVVQELSATTPREVEVYLQIGFRMPAQVVVAAICVLLIFFGVRTIRRATCARKSTLEDITKTAEARRHSKWLAVRLFELVQEVKGPNSPYVFCQRTETRTVYSLRYMPPSLTALLQYHSLSHIPTPHLLLPSPTPRSFLSPDPSNLQGTGPSSC